MITVSVRFVTLDHPAAPGSPWSVWVRRHGIDPRRVIVPSELECDDIARTITYLDAEFPDKQWRVIQLESPALPFPDNGEYDTGYATGDNGKMITENRK